MAGTNAGFDADEFRAAIEFAMTMGAPVDPSKQVTFYWNTDRTFVEADSAGVPWDLNETPVLETAHTPVRVPAAVQFAGPADDDTAFGRIDTSSAILTLLDIHYDQVRTADYVTIGGDIYDFRSVMPQGLFDATVWTMNVVARSKA